jgi:rubrerythrin
VAVERNRLTSFGQLLNYVIKMENDAADTYKVSSGSQLVPKVLANLAETHARRVKALERARRQNVNEVLLEPIGGLWVPDCALQPSDVTDNTLCRNLDFVLESLAVSELEWGRFYLDATENAGHILGEITQLFRKYAKENQTHVMELRTLLEKLGRSIE